MSSARFLVYVMASVAVSFIAVATALLVGDALHPTGWDSLGLRIAVGISVAVAGGWVVAFVPAWWRAWYRSEDRS